MSLPSIASASIRLGTCRIWMALVAVVPVALAARLRPIVPPANTSPMRRRLFIRGECRTAELRKDQSWVRRFGAIAGNAQRQHLVRRNARSQFLRDVALCPDDDRRARPRK